MKIVFTGGGTGGHFYPIIAVSEEIQAIVEERKLLAPRLYYIATHPYDEKLLYERDIHFVRAPAGKIRTYASIDNFFDLFRTAFGCIKALFILFSIYPDVVFSKGSYVSVPTVFAARILRIPVVIHDSDAIPGRANIWAAKRAEKIGLSYPSAIDFIPEKFQDKVAVIGNPVRKEIVHAEKGGGHDFFGFRTNMPTLLILGGSQGATRINETILKALPDLLSKYQIIHQTGPLHEVEVKGTAAIILEQYPDIAHRYKTFGYLDDLHMRMAAGAADIIISRAGSGSIFEASAWKVPTILIPITEEVSRDQTKNAYAVARMGGAQVIEEHNLTPHVLAAEIERLVQDEQLRITMSEKLGQLYRPDAARKIAELLVAICLGHQDE